MDELAPRASTSRIRVGKWLLILSIGIVMIGVYWWARGRSHRDPSDEMAQASERLRTFDASQRNGADFAHLPPWDQLSGPDPYALAKIPGSLHTAALLRGDDAIVVLDDAMHEVERLSAPASPVALAVAEDGAIFVAGEQSNIVARYQWQNARLEPAGTFDLGDIRAVRGLAAGQGGWIYVAEEQKGTLVGLRLERHGVENRITTRTEMARCRGPIRLARISTVPERSGAASPGTSRVADRLIADCLLDHSLLVHDLEPSGAPAATPPVRIAHDGPIWSFDAVATKDALLIAAGGVEDHPLDRTIGAFGYIDSFLFLYRYDTTSRTATREAAINLSERGVVTPKAIVLSPSPLAVTVAGYGSDKLAHFSFPEGFAGRPVVSIEPFVPGANAVIALDGARLALADPLLDAWIVAKNDAASDAPPGVLPVASQRTGSARKSPTGPETSPAEAEMRLGESLFFTTLMAPYNSSEGALSRFTCETCHFEGYVDGRIHHTGRDDVHAVTKPLLGLFNNRPHFSRALDPDLTAVAFNEFRVAGAKSGHDPWFSVDASSVPWVRLFGQNDATLSPESMRKALMSFLITFQHRPNPAVLGRASFSDLERRGAELFRDRCENCHEARLASDQPASRAPFDRWETLVMAREGAIVWGKDVYEKTGVLPYVHEKGARVPSLRRLYKKHPYFTNGSADSMDDVLRRARFLPTGFQHEVTQDDASRDVEYSLDVSSRAALASFLALL